MEDLKRCWSGWKSIFMGGWQHVGAVRAVSCYLISAVASRAAKKRLLLRIQSRERPADGKAQQSWLSWEILQSLPWMIHHLSSSGITSAAGW